MCYLRPHDAYTCTYTHTCTGPCVSPPPLRTYIPSARPFLRKQKTKSNVGHVHAERDFVMAMALNAADVHKVEQRDAEELLEVSPLTVDLTRLEHSTRTRSIRLTGRWAGC